eukprot:365066-Chlamydomonas_euryale.AAC.5
MATKADPETKSNKCEKPTCQGLSYSHAHMAGKELRDCMRRKSIDWRCIATQAPEIHMHCSLGCQLHPGGCWPYASSSGPPPARSSECMQQRQTAGWVLHTSTLIQCKRACRPACLLHRCLSGAAACPPQSPLPQRVAL